MAAIVVARLVVEPQLARASIAVQKRRQAFAPQPHALERLLVLHQRAADFPRFDFLGFDPQILTPLRHGQIEHLRQLINRRRRGQIGVQREVLALNLADAGRAKCRFVDRARSLLSVLLAFLDQIGKRSGRTPFDIERRVGLRSRVGPSRGFRRRFVTLRGVSRRILAIGLLFPGGRRR